MGAHMEARRDQSPGAVVIGNGEPSDMDARKWTGSSVKASNCWAVSPALKCFKEFLHLFMCVCLSVKVKTRRQLSRMNSLFLLWWVSRIELTSSAFACWAISLFWSLTSIYYIMFPVSIFRLPIGCGSLGRMCEASQQRSERLSPWTYLHLADSNVRAIVILWGSAVCSSHKDMWQYIFTCVTISGFFLFCERSCWELPGGGTKSSKRWLDNVCGIQLTLGTWVNPYFPRRGLLS